MSVKADNFNEIAVTKKAPKCGNLGKTSSVRPYVLITPAKNEAEFIRGALASVIAQTIRPSQWIIVDDGSTDETARVVEEYVARYPFIHLLRLASCRQREFSSKVTAFNAGLEALTERDYSFLGNLDADIRLDPDYYETVLESFQKDADLGIAGGKVYTTVTNEFICRDNTLDSVGGAIQLFRRKCFEEIGGYRSLPFGGIDAAAEISARWKGWKVKKIEQKVYEQRQTGSSQNSVWKARYRDGLKFHSLGYGGPFFTCKCVFRLTDSPKCLGSMLSMIGFVCAQLRKYPVYMPKDAVAYLRSEQNAKLRYWLYRIGRKPHRTAINDDEKESKKAVSAGADVTRRQI
jgi:biofilm PGA synthesis N-glycosyltransferase PgaC